MTQAATRLRRQHAVMGTVATVELYDPVPDERTVDAVFAWLHEVDQRFSTYRADSEVCRLVRGELSVADYSPELWHVLDACARLWRETDGYFDVYATGSFDPSGYVKGWSVQVASERLSASGAVNHLVDAGGDIQTRGRPAPDRDWQIGIRHPWQKAMWPGYSPAAISRWRPPARTSVDSTWSIRARALRLRTWSRSPSWAGTSPMPMPTPRPRSRWVGRHWPGCQPCAGTRRRWSSRMAGVRLGRPAGGRVGSGRGLEAIVRHG